MTVFVTVNLYVLVFYCTSACFHTSWPEIFSCFICSFCSVESVISHLLILFLPNTVAVLMHCGLLFVEYDLDVWLCVDLPFFFLYISSRTSAIVAGTPEIEHHIYLWIALL